MMFALGGIFTSCIDNVEPDGVEAMREAHAKYLLACASLVEADATVQAAQAAYVNAQADAVKAETEYQRILNQIAEIDLAIAKAESEAEIAGYQAEKDSILNAWEVQKLKDKETLAQAQADLEQALKEIELEKLTLSTEEKAIIKSITNAYADAAANYNHELGEYLDAYEEAVTDAAIEDAKYETFEAKMDLKLEEAKAIKDRLQKEVDFWLMIKDEYVSQWVEELESLTDSIESYRPRLIELATEKAYIIANNFPEIEAQYKADAAAAAKVKDDALAELTPVAEPSAKFGKKYNLPSYSNAYGYDIVDIFRLGVEGNVGPSNDGTPYSTIGHDVAITAPFVDTLKVNVPKLTEAVADYVMNANDTMVGFNNLVKLIEAPYAYDFSDFTAEQLASTKAYRDSLSSLYAAIVARLGASSNYKATYEALHEAWYDKAVAPYKALKALLGTDANGVIDYSGVAAACNLLSHIAVPSTYADHTASGTYTPDYNADQITTCANAADSAKFVKYIVDLGAAVKALDDTLEGKFAYKNFDSNTAMAQNDTILFSEVVVSGLTLSATNSALLTANILKVSPYDNKGVDMSELGVQTPDSSKYLDGLTRLFLTLRTYIDTNKTALEALIGSVKDIDPMNRLTGPSTVLPWAELPETYKGKSAETEADALYRWLEDCYIYYGEVGHQADAFAASNGEYLGFVYKTFKDLDNNYLAVFFDGAFTPYFTPNFSELVHLDFHIQYLNGNGSPADIFALLYLQNPTLVQNPTLDSWGKMNWERTLVFKLFAAEEYYAQMSDVTRLDRWNAIKAIIAQVDADMTAFITAYNTANTSYTEYTKKVNAITKTYDDAIKAAQDKADSTVKARIDPIEEEIAEIQDKIDGFEGLYNALKDIYSVAVLAEYTGTVADYYAGWDEPGSGLSHYEVALHFPGSTSSDAILYVAYAIYREVDHLYDYILRVETEIARIESYRSLREDADYQALLKEYNDGYLKMLKEVVDDAEFWRDFYKSKYDALIAIYKAEI